jgi:hypothetical protein
MLTRGEAAMESQKSEVLQEMVGKGLTLSEAAQKAGFDPELLRLYFAEDAYPVPQRIIGKLKEAMNN